MVKKEGEIGDKLSEIRFSGIFDYENFYLTVYNWLKDHYYNVNEVYKHKMTSSGAEVELSFKGERKESEFVKYIIEVETHFWDLIDTDVVIDGKKKKLNKARCTIIIRWKVILDYQSQFDKSEFLIRLFNMLRFSVLKMKILAVWAGKLIGESYRLQTKIKEELGMYTAYNAY
ncbi:MAG: hypothetical protein QXG86_01480 [Candidatus Woesearchaeota archaeon]